MNLGLTLVLLGSMGVHALRIGIKFQGLLCFLLPFVAAMVLVGYFLMLRGKKWIGRDGQYIVEDRSIRPVVYLRSFVDDCYGLLGVFRGNEPRSDEEELEETLGSLGPMIAIGRPGEGLQTPGAARVYVADDQWQELVQELTARARLIVVRVGNSEGLWWEIEHLVRTVNPHQVLFYLAFRGLKRRRQRAYTRFRKRAAGILPRELPEQLGKARFLWFGPGWIPRLLGVQGATFATRVMGLTRHGTRVPLFHELLLPVFDSLGEPQGRWRPTTRDWLAFYGMIVGCLVIPVGVCLFLLLIILRVL